MKLNSIENHLAPIGEISNSQTPQLANRCALDPESGNENPASRIQSARHESTNPAIQQSSSAPSLRLFTRPEILAQIGHTRVGMFLNSFTDGFKTIGIELPSSETTDTGYFCEIASFFSNTETIPHRLLHAALTLEAAASPENDARLDEVIRRRLPCISLNRNCPLDCALELWFACPDELPQFAPPLSNSKTPELPNSSPSSIENPASGTETENPLNTENCTLNTPPAHIPSPLPNSQTPELLNSDRDLLDDLASVLARYVVLPPHAADALALWIVHTYCFQFRDVSTYIGIESPVKRCGKTTLLSVLGRLVNNPVMASNISPSAFFHVIEKRQPTLLIDEADTFLQGNDELRGILNAGYYQPNAYVIRVSNEPSSPRRSEGKADPSESPLNTENCTLNTRSEVRHSSFDISHSSSGLRHYSTWCPKAIATIDRLPETLADRCILIRMQRKLGNEECERLRNLDPTGLRKLCTQFSLEHQKAITTAIPQTPPGLNDRACDIWEPLFAVADIAGGDWPEKARAAAVALTNGAQENSASSTLLFDIGLLFMLLEKERLFTSQIVSGLNCNRFAGRPWMEARKGKPVTEIWLSQQLRPFGVRPKNLRIDGELRKGYELSDLQEIFSRYVPHSEIDTFRAELLAKSSPSAAPA